MVDIISRSWGADESSCSSYWILNTQFSNIISSVNIMQSVVPATTPYSTTDGNNGRATTQNTKEWRLPQSQQSHNMKREIISCRYERFKRIWAPIIWAVSCLRPSLVVCLDDTASIFRNRHEQSTWRLNIKHWLHFENTSHMNSEWIKGR